MQNVVTPGPRQFDASPKTIAIRSLDSSSQFIIASRGKRCPQLQLIKLAFKDSIALSIPTAFKAIIDDLSIALRLKSHQPGFGYRKIEPNLS